MKHLVRLPKPIRANTAELLPLEAYDYFLVSFSGGKDSLACVLYLLELGVPPEKIQLWHQLVDGALEDGERNFFDWAITEDYCRAISDGLGVLLHVDSPLKFQWKVGGFAGEMLRDDEPTNGICFDNQEGERTCLPPGAPKKLGTRLKFPQKGSDMSTRNWVNPWRRLSLVGGEVRRRAIMYSARWAFEVQILLPLTR